MHSVENKTINKKQAIISDLDGSLALINGRSPFDWKKCGTDNVNESMARTINLYVDSGAANIIVTGRSEVCRPETLLWLKEHRIPFTHMYMRRTGDYRDDATVKLEIYQESIEPLYKVILVMDDRLRVCRMWYKLGLPIFRLGDPDATF